MSNLRDREMVPALLVVLTLTVADIARAGMMAQMMGGMGGGGGGMPGMGGGGGMQSMMQNMRPGSSKDVIMHCTFTFANMRQ